jgi:hypothetical protein
MADKPHNAPPGDATLDAVLRAAREVPPEDLGLEVDDPDLEALIDRAVAPHAHTLTPEGLAEARATLALVFTTHPRAMAALDRERVQPPNGGSGVVVKRGAASLSQAADDIRRAGGKGQR